MTRQEQWNRDTAIEKMASDFLDKHFYAILSAKADVIRYSDTYHQFGGIDVSINTTNIDEKCKTYGCLNKVQPYVGFECSMLNKAGNVSDGWFMNGSISTDYWLFIGLSTISEASSLESADQISAADVLWVKRTDMTSFIDKLQGMAILKQEADELRSTSDAIETDADDTYSSMPDCLGYGKHEDGKYRTRFQHGMFWLTYSSHMHEKPVNLVVRRETLEKLPHSKHYIVTKDKVVRA